MSRQGSGRPTYSTAIRFPPELHDRLRQAAEDRDVSINWLVVRACEDFLPRLLPAEEIVWTRPVVFPDSGPPAAPNPGYPGPGIMSSVDMPVLIQERCWLACGDDARPCHLDPHHEGPCTP